VTDEQEEAASRVNDQVRQEAAATCELPLAYMLRNMRDPSQPVARRDGQSRRFLLPFAPLGG
jgi:hypothetical protein